MLQACQIHGMLRLERCCLAVYIVLYIVLSCHYGLQLCSCFVAPHPPSGQMLAVEMPWLANLQKHPLAKIFGKSLGIPASVFPLPVAAIPQNWHFSVM